ARGGPPEHDVGPQRVQRHPTLAVPFAARHLGAAQAAAQRHPDALGARAHGAQDGLLHGAPVADSALDLAGDVLGHQLSVQLGLRAGVARAVGTASSRSSTTAVMWQVRWKYWWAMPRLTGRMRFMVGPSSTISAFTTRSSRLRLKLCSALAAADLMTLATSSAACRGENSRKASASATGMPRTASAISRALRGVRRMYFAFAMTSIRSVNLRYLFGLIAVAAEAAGGCELAQPVADHVLVDQHGHV